MKGADETVGGVGCRLVVVYRADFILREGNEDWRTRHGGAQLFLYFTRSRKRHGLNKRFAVLFKAFEGRPRASHRFHDQRRERPESVLFYSPVRSWLSTVQIIEKGRTTR